MKEPCEVENDGGTDPVDAVVIRPGRGWNHIAGSVYGHKNGLRLHMLGMLRLPTGEFVSANNWPESQIVGKYVRINGGNWRRGLMAWAMNKVDG